MIDFWICLVFMKWVVRSLDFYSIYDIISLNLINLYLILKSLSLALIICGVVVIVLLSNGFVFDAPLFANGALNFGPYVYFDWEKDCFIILYEMGLL